MNNLGHRFIVVLVASLRGGRQTRFLPWAQKILVTSLVSIKHSGEEVDASFGYKILELVKFPGVG